MTDNGVGMTPEVISRAFDPFFTTKPIGKGTGLGLSMIYGFVRQSGGQVRIYSEIGQGTTVSLYLPRYFGAVDAPPLEEPEAAEAGLGETVLVVDDEESVRMLVIDTLAREWLSQCDRGRPTRLEAHGEILEHRTVAIDLLITDVGLPGGMNGRQVADAARVRRARI